MSGNLYAIGDVQGCLESLEGLLEQLPGDAELLFVGDLVNRGPQSLETLRFIMGLGDRATALLGNHDMHLLACAAGAGKVHRKDTIGPILEAPDAGELLDWVRTRPLMVERDGVIFVHAGVPPLWDLPTARALAHEVEAELAGDDWKRSLAHMYGKTQWAPDLTGDDRLRAILNGFTRMRFVDRETGLLDFDQKEGVGRAPANLVPWFEFRGRKPLGAPVCFGHWSMLGLINRPDLMAIDTGCLWGGELTAVRIPDRRLFTENCPCWSNPLA
ncbi:symmetrical bis(5'-nucleosyl)-tetraphosphatase [Sutterella sp.]|uniref:symmetrical bis(5'-nucleosyl)-tetraphosphatase n=1 Tax=Sutterella sp. TaxID=1981025 RepID=UPI0026DF09B0|nr:symmetrical bis(5'-nucleosyl)-tetraphosphatase [Sutterella sp.]MDO5530666.1 symmetrical bis(5'-nucleosyl)-tetraphosphatase [Sutterella sp.]